ncbi:MAG: double-strand break repair protein AddB, partial [Rhodospirillales bacterium]|nr:double-strand break repair protein AddB [Rhodospirillales bacterium]
MPRATVYNIPPGWSFVDALARGMMDRAHGDSLVLAGQLVLLPSRRACRALREAFLRLTEGRPLLLPRMLPLGEADEDEMVLAGDGLDLPPAIPPLRRQLLLARLVLAMGGGRGGQAPSPDQATQLAGELAHLLDQVQTEGLDFSRLTELVPADYAEHWQITLDFLKVITEHWPAILAEQGYMDAAQRRAELILAQAEAWQRSHPAQPVIAAGSTGSIPTTAALLTSVARLPNGTLVLPGLDPWMRPEAWD